MKDELKEAKQEIYVGAGMVTFGLFIGPLLGAMLPQTIIAAVLYSPLVIIMIVSGGVGLIVKGTSTKKRLKTKTQ